MFVLELSTFLTMFYLAIKIHKIDKNTELYVRFEATNPQSSNINQHNSVKSQNSQGSSDSWVGASVNS
jgi:hypothetical protein